jgi:hypothetical protein
VKIIGKRADHNAFTDLTSFNKQLYCCFREAQDHVSVLGNIRILTLDPQGNVQGSTQLALANTDLRDPKLTLMPDNRLLLTAYARQGAIATQPAISRNLSWVSQDGHSWSGVSEFADNGWWLWRLTWHKGLAYGFAYNRRQNAIHLYKGDPRRSFFLHQPRVLSLQKHGKGYPNESAIIFSEDQAFAVVRRDADTYTAQLGRSHFPYKKWIWQDLAMYIGGPTMLQIKPEKALVAGRVLHNNNLVTALLTLNVMTGQLNPVCILPSAGDNSYPGMQQVGNLLYLSYYSSHMDNKSQVYLAQLDISELLNQ